MAYQWGAPGWIEADGKRLEAATWGPPPGEVPTIVMLHEGLGCIALWRDFPQALAAATGWGVLAYSRAGYGQSDKAALPRAVDYMTHDAGVVLPDVLDAIGFQCGVLLGHSDGATIAAEYLGEHEDLRIRGLILMAPHFFTEPGGRAEIDRALMAYETTNMRAKMARYHADPDHTFHGWRDAWLNPAFRDWDVTDCIDYFRVPTLAIQGRDDQYGSLAQINVIAERSYAPVELEVLQDCRHVPHQEQPEQTLALIADYIARLTRIEGEKVAPA